MNENEFCSISTLLNICAHWLMVISRSVNLKAKNLKEAGTVHDLKVDSYLLQLIYKSIRSHVAHVVQPCVHVLVLAWPCREGGKDEQMDRHRTKMNIMHTQLKPPLMM